MFESNMLLCVYLKVDIGMGWIGFLILEEIK